MVRISSSVDSSISRGFNKSEPMDMKEEVNAPVTLREQWIVESQVFGIYKHFNELPRRAQTVMLEIVADMHSNYLTNGLQCLPPSFCVLDANRPWLCYWILHSIALLGESVDENLEKDVVNFLNRCKDPLGGYGGGPGQMPHLATTYASINALITLGGNRALSSINRDKLYAFLQRMKDPCGSFRMHEMGEIDVRACYTAISVASILNILDLKLVETVGDYILSCQTYEGGIAGEPGSEAHGGYTFCGLATMILIDEAHRLDLPALINWVAFRQGVEGGFQGRTNKLVDGCYSFWQGGVFPQIQRLQQIIEEQLGMASCRKHEHDSVERNHKFSGGTCQMDSGSFEEKGLNGGLTIEKFSDIGLDFVKRPAFIEPLFQNFALQQYIILCSQVMDGGFRDKPGKGRDFYHTCYCLSGLSVCQHISLRDADCSPAVKEVLGPYSNLLEPTHPLYNVILVHYYYAHEFFSHS
ncbi:Protein farnesyltransferase subunit beta [Bienertia sinuspersici]